MADARRYVRRKTLLGGKMEFRGNSTFDCVVRDLSEAGARLRCDHHIAVPDTFELVIAKLEERRPVRVVWRREGELGLAFRDVAP